MQITFFTLNVKSHQYCNLVQNKWLLVKEHFDKNQLLLRHQGLVITNNLTDCVKVSHPNQHKIGHFGDALPSQSLD